MSTGKDARHKSGEHHIEADTPDQQLSAITDLPALGVEIRSVRREMRNEFVHINRSLETFTRAIEDLYNKTNTGLQHCSGHDAQIVSLDGRVKRIEKKEESDVVIAAVKAVQTPSSFPAHHQDPGRQAIATTVWNTLARNRAIPWAVAAVLAIIVIMAALTGRSADGLTPYRKEIPVLLHQPDAKAAQPDAPKP